MNFSLASSLALAVTLVARAQDAGAFCRTRTCEFSNTQDCELDADLCSTVGKPATWGSGCISFAIQSEGSVAQGISAAKIGTLVGDGFKVWSDANCGDGVTPELNGVDRGDIACDVVEFNCEEPADNNNIILFRDGPSDLPSQTIALSTIIANLTTGEILDVDIELNSYRYQFNGEGDNPTDLAVVINHELGHLLGLSHSRDPDSLMRVAYGADYLLGDDDVAGICASYPFSDSDPSCTGIAQLGPDAQCSGDFTACRVQIPAPPSSGCAIGPTGPVRGPLGGGWAWMGILAVLGGGAAIRRSERTRQRG